jgi:hypothetical protein
MVNNLMVLASAQLQSSRSSSGAGLLSDIILLLLALVILVAYWKVFAKAGHPGWASIVPIYSSIVMLSIAGKPWWWIFLMMIPIVNFFVILIVMDSFAKAFNKGSLFALGLLLLSPIFMSILGFGDAEYVGV